jgi:hypothetical protein
MCPVLGRYIETNKLDIASIALLVAPASSKLWGM